MYSSEQFMNPGPAPRPPTDKPKLNLIPAVNNLPGNMSAMSLNSSINGSPYTANSSTSSLGRGSTNERGSGGAFKVLKDGMTRMREEGLLQMWKDRWLNLRETQLDFHKSANSQKINLSVQLKDVTNVARSENHPLAFEITLLAKPGVVSGSTAPRDAPMKTIICKVDTDDDVYSWIDSIYERCPSMGGVSNPINFAHQVHVGYDPTNGSFTGLPPEWAKLLGNSAITKEDYANDPTAVIEVLNFYTHEMNRHKEESGSRGMMSSTPTGDSGNEKQLGYMGSGGASVAPPRPKPPHRYESHDALRPNAQSPEARTPIDDSPMEGPSSQEIRAKMDQEKRRREDDERRQREQRDRREKEQRDRERQEREEQAAYNASLPQTKTPLAKQEVGGGAYGGAPAPAQSSSSRYNPSRTAPSAPSNSRDRQQVPNGQMAAPRAAPRPPGPEQRRPSESSASTSKLAPSKSYEQREPSPLKRPEQTNGTSTASTRIPVKPQEQSSKAPTAGTKPLNITVKEPTGPAAIAEAARKMEEGPSPKTRKEARMSSMTEAQVMTKLREVVSKDDPLKSYNKQKKIGQGASGSVYVAKLRESAISPFARRIIDKQGPRAQVAIKQMDLRNQPRKELIVNEIVVMKDSKHPNIVNFIEAFLPEEQYELWVVMEFMEGGPLTDVIDNNPSISEAQIATICLEVCTDIRKCLMASC